MGVPAAKKGDEITATDVHLIQPPAPAPPTTIQHPFKGTINGNLSANVNIMGKPAAMMNSTATNTHKPIGGTFVEPPSNRGSIIAGSPTVFINGKPAARSGDTAITCNYPVDLPVGKVVAKGTVFIG
jgi:uncharacterized Zn-binding protein involved in type VI secretion